MSQTSQMTQFALLANEIESAIESAKEERGTDDEPMAPSHS